MDAASVWKMLADIKIGTLIAWCIVIIVIVTTIFRGVKSAYAFITKYNELREINERQSKLLEEHDRTFNEINERLGKISKSLDEQKEINLKYTRHIIVDACHDAISARGIQIEKLASLEEMYDEYINVFNGNSYVCGLVKRVRGLPIIEIEDERVTLQETSTHKLVQE